MKKYFKHFIKELIPVLLGVLIALWINNWNEDRKDREYIRNFYSSLSDELRDTNEEIIEVTPFQEQLVDTLEFYSSDNQISLMEVIEKAGGLKGPFIQLNYWKALSNSKIELIEYEKLSILADIEDASELLKINRNKLIDYVYENMIETGTVEKAVFKNMMVQAIRTQKEIQMEIQKILDE